MGSPPTERDRSNEEGPQHGVTIREPFAAGRLGLERDAGGSGRGGAGGGRPRRGGGGGGGGGESGRGGREARGGQICLDGDWCRRGGAARSADSAQAALPRPAHGSPSAVPTVVCDCGRCVVSRTRIGSGCNAAYAAPRRFGVTGANDCSVSTIDARAVRNASRCLPGRAPITRSSTRRAAGPAALSTRRPSSVSLTA